MKQMVGLGGLEPPTSPLSGWVTSMQNLDIKALSSFLQGSADVSADVLIPFLIPPYI